MSEQLPADGSTDATSPVPVGPSGLSVPIPRSPLGRWRAARDDLWASQQLRDALKWAFRDAAIGAGLGLSVDAPVAGTSQRTPTVTNIDLGPPTRFTVRMLGGQVPAQLARVGRLIAPHLGGIGLRVTDRGHGWALVELLTVDPLAVVVPLLLPRPDILLGRLEDGRWRTLDRPEDLPHIIAQGQTRSGKSTWLYALLAQLAGRVEVAGVDPSRLTLGPFAGPRVVLGLNDLEAVEGVLAGLVADMDERLAAMPSNADVLPLTHAHPLRLVVLEEWPGTLRALEADQKQLKRCRALVARLLAESHKVGYRVILACQRAEAAIVGGTERAQCGGRLSFRVDSLDSVKLLHPDCDDLVAEHAAAPAGIALISWPGQPLTRMRAPLLTYAEYTAAVAEGRPL